MVILRSFFGAAPRRSRAFVLVSALAWPLCLIPGGFAHAADDRADEASGIPACMRDPSFWAGRQVIQVFGHVFAEEDQGDVVRSHYWRLGPAAMGKVAEITADRCCLVEFADATDWQRQELPDDLKKRTETTFEYDRDNYGRIQGVKATTVTREGIRIPEREWGRIVSSDGERRRVKFPIECLGLPRPLVGQKVVRGPDWRAGHADGGARPVGPLSEDASQFWGEVIGEHDADYYVLVRWNVTGREGAYRYDKRRFYDVLVMDEPDADGRAAADEAPAVK